MRRRIEEPTLTIVRGAHRFRVRVFRWVTGRARCPAVWSPAEIEKIRKAMGK